MKNLLCFLVVFLFIFGILLIMIYLVRCCKRLSGCWYLKKNNKKIVQGFFPVKDTPKIISVEAKKHMTKIHLEKAYSALIPGQTYITNTHLLKVLKRKEKQGQVQIIECEPAKQRFVWEFTLTHGAKWYIKRRLSPAAKSNGQIYKRFYDITFKKL